MSRYAVRADYDKRIYEVYDVTTNATVETFKYKARESERAKASGRAFLALEELNRDNRA